MEAARLAYVRAETAGHEQARLNEALARTGFGMATLFVHAPSGSYGFGSLRPGDGTRLVAFRGTQPDDLKDLLTDLTFPPVDWPESGGRVHAGFAQATRGLLPALRDWLSGPGAGTGPLVLAGHSLGAAIATLAAALLKPALLVTLGSPRVGDASFVAAQASAPCARFVDCTDIVTTVPPAVLGYVHVRPPSYIDSSGLVQEDPNEALMTSDGRSAKVAYALRHAWIPGNVGLRSFADHAPINYLW
jgi:predicted lipase